MKFQSFTNHTFGKSEYFQRLPVEEQSNYKVLASFFHFKVNRYVLDHLIDWSNIPADPIYKMVFPKKEMVPEYIFQMVKGLVDGELPVSMRKNLFRQMRNEVAPKSRFSESSICRDRKGRVISGMYLGVPSILSLFPSPMVRTCHSYCNYCFRWVMFGDNGIQSRSSYSDPVTPVDWLRLNPEVSDCLFTGADPMTCNSKTLAEYIEPLLGIKTVRTIRIGTKSLAWWPFRFTHGKDGEDLMDLFSRVTGKGKKLILLAHFSHPRELRHPEVMRAATRITNTGAEIHTQGPLIREVNDTANSWSEMWNMQSEMRMIPKFMFIEGNHNSQAPFSVPLSQALKVFQEAKRRLSVEAPYLKGPLFLLDLNRVLLDGTTTLNGQQYFVLKTLQAPPGCDSEGDIRLVPYDEHALDLGNLYELFNGKAETVS